MLYREDKYLAAIVVGLNFFMMGIEESSLYTILPKYFNNLSNFENTNQTFDHPINETGGCYIQKPQYVIVSMIFLAKNLGQLIVNAVIGGIADKINNYFILLISHCLGIVISIIYAFSNTIPFYIVGRLLDALVSCAIFVSTFSMIAKLFTNAKVRARYFGLANIMYFISHSIGPVYGAEIDDKFNKSAVFLFLIPMWCMCSFFTVIIYWKIKRNEKEEAKLMKDNPIYEGDLTKTEPGKIDDQNPVDFVKSKTELETGTKEMNENSSPNKNKKSMLREYFSMFKDPYVLACVFQIFIINLSIFSLPPTLPSWMAFKLCCTEVQQGSVWTFGFLGYLSGVFVIVIVTKRISKLQLYVPVLAHILIGILLIMLPFTRDWRLVFIPVIGMYLTIGIVEQVIFPITTVLADYRFQSNYGAVSSLTSQSLTMSGVIGTLLSGYIANKYGFISLAISIGIINLIFSPLSMIHLKYKS